MTIVAILPIFSKKTIFFLKKKNKSDKKGLMLMGINDTKIWEYTDTYGRKLFAETHLNVDNEWDYSLYAYNEPKGLKYIDGGVYSDYISADELKYIFQQFITPDMFSCQNVEVEEVDTERFDTLLYEW